MSDAKRNTLKLDPPSSLATIRGMEPNPYEAPSEVQYPLPNRRLQWETAAKLGVIATFVSLFAGYMAYDFVAGVVFAAERATLGEAHNSANSRHFESGLLAALVTLGFAGAISVAGIWAYVRRL